MTNLVDKDNFAKAFYDEMTLGDTPQRTRFRQKLTLASAAPVSATLLENASVQQNLLKARKPGIPSNYPTKGDYTLYVNPPSKLSGETDFLMPGGRGSLFLAAYQAPLSFLPTFQSNKPSNPEISLSVGATPGLRNRVNIATPGYWAVHFNFTLGFRPTTPTTDLPKLVAGGMHALVQFLCSIKVGTNALRYAPLFEQRILRSAFTGAMATSFSGSFEVQLNSAGYLEFNLKRSPTIGYYGDTTNNPEKIGLIKITSQDVLQDPSEDIGNFVRLTRLA